MESDLRCSRHFDEYSEVSGVSVGGSPRGQYNFTDHLPLSLLNDPNTSSPANVEASNLYKDNRREYTKRVRETVERSWED